MITESTGTELRKTGISVIGDVRWGTHFCYFYETKQDLLEAQVLYFKAGLESKEFCLWLVSQALSVEEAKHALGQAVPDLERHLGEGALEIRDYHEWYLRDGRWDPQQVLQFWREKLNQTLANGYAGLRAAGDGGWIQNDDWMGFRDYEEQVNALIAGQRSIILCTYPLTTSPGDQVFDVAHIHQLAVARRNGSWELVETPELKQAKAEIKRLNEGLEQKVEERTRELAAANEALRAEIAERKLAEEAVKQAEDRIRLVIDTIPTMAWSLRPDGIVDFVNQRWLDYTGLSFKDAIIEPNCIVHPEDLSRAVEKWLKDMAAGESSEDEIRLRRADGEYRWFLVRTVPLRDKLGKITKWYGVSIDIEDRKQAEMQSRALIDAIPQQIWSGPPDGTTDYCNDRWRSYTGLEMEDLRGYGWQTMVHPEDRDRVLKAWHESAANGTPYEQEERHRGTDGTYRWFLSLGVPMRDAEGRIVRWYGTNTDIEDRKRAEEALRKSEKLFAVFMDRLPGFAWIKDIEGRYVYVNKRESELDAYRGGAIGKTDAELWPTEIASIYRANDHQVIITRKAMQTVEPSVADGEQCYMLVTKFPIFDQDGSVVMVAGAGVDITDRIHAEQALRESEERFRELTENIDEVFWLTDSKHTAIFYVSPAYEKLWGRSCDSLYASPRSWTDALHFEDRERVLRILADHELQPVPDMVYRIIRPDGSTRWVHARGFPVKDPEGKIVRVAGVVEDITERKRVELALDERLRFETLLTELSAAFANLPTTAVDREIYKWLQNLVEFLDVDRATFDQVREDGKTLWRSHSHTARGIDPLPLNVTKDRTPWLTEQLIRGNTIKWSRIPDDIPEQASKEKEFAGRFGAKSVLAIPVCIGGSVICAVSFTSMRIYRDWPDEMVARLRLVGEIFANAVARKQAQETLFRREAELNEAQRLASIGSWEWDILADGVTCSNEVRRIYGREDQNSPDRPFSEFVHPDDRARRSAAIDAALKSGPPYNVEFRIIRPDKSLRFVHSRGRLIYDEAGKPVRMLGMTQDITERKRSAKELEEANHQLRLLSGRLFEVQEEERRHLARELHDEIGQALTAAKINLQSVAANGGGANFARLQETTGILDRLLGQVRQISLNLRPSMLDDLGLVPALRSLLDEQGRRASVEVRFSEKNMPEKLEPEIQTTCFRIAQEAITNAVRHSHATHIDLDLRCKNGKLRLLVRDNGTGFDAESAQTQTIGLGLIGIQERAALLGGRAKIISSPNKGTTVDVSLPLTLRTERQDGDLGK
jgi:PAS domain S-box-containing protein